MEASGGRQRTGNTKLSPALKYGKTTGRPANNASARTTEQSVAFSSYDEQATECKCIRVAEMPDDIGRILAKLTFSPRTTRRDHTLH